MIRFILNDKTIETDLPPGMVLLDLIRYHQHLMGTKIGCREGDCGACTVLVGSLINDKLVYRSMTCCLMPLANAAGKHIVTVEGINGEDLNPIQKAMSENGATQCGFCTPGFVVSLTGYCLSNNKGQENVRAAIDGNICRCTGYKSIERAAEDVANLMRERTSDDIVGFAVDKAIVPSYFKKIKERLESLARDERVEQAVAPDGKQVIVSGGTDLYVQRHEEMVTAKAEYKLGNEKLSGIRIEGNKCIIGGSVNVTDLKESPDINKIFPRFSHYAKLISSTPIRNMATLAGNFVNASPIGDLTIFFLALNAEIRLVGSNAERWLPLKKFYKGYKSLDKNHDETLAEISFNLPSNDFHFNFEKVSKRTHLDIASVNTAISFRLNDNIISSASISAGGVGPIPTYLEVSSQFLNGKVLNESVILDCLQCVRDEISPISDARGSKEYKSLLLQQLIKAHFITLFPNMQTRKLLTAS